MSFHYIFLDLCKNYVYTVVNLISFRYQLFLDLVGSLSFFMLHLNILPIDS